MGIRPSFSVQFTAQVLDTSLTIGDLLVFDSAEDVWKKATLANRTAANARTTGIAMAPYGGSVIGAVTYKDGGAIDADTADIGPGAAGWVRASDAGRIERVASPASGDDIVGTCDAAGRVHLQFGVWDSANISGGGGGAVADDIAKSSGTTIDRVRGIRSVAIDGPDGAPSVGTSLVYNAQGTPGYRRKKPSPWFDITDFGADPTGVSDSLPAVLAAMAACRAASPRGGRIHIPDGAFRIASRLDLLDRIMLAGANNSEGGSGAYTPFGSRLVFDPGAFICAYGSTNGYPGYATGTYTATQSVIRDLGLLKSSKATTTALPLSTAVTIGSRYKRTASSSEIDYWCYNDLVCIKAGTTAGTMPTVPATADEFSVPFTPGATYKLGEVVRGSTGGVAIDGTGSNLVTTHMFKCTTAGTAGGAHPAWNASDGATTTTGSAVFTAYPVGEYWVTSGTAVFRAASDSLIYSYTKLYLERLYVYNAGTPGIHFRGNTASSLIASNCNGWNATNIRIVDCAIGIMPHGSDALGVGINIDVQNAGKGLSALGRVGIGIYDSSGVGCTWIGCQIANDPNQGGGHSILADDATSKASFIDCYTEGFQVSTLLAAHLPSATINVLGGKHGAGFTTLEYPAKDGTHSNAQPRSLPESLGGSKNLALRSRIATTRDVVSTGTGPSVSAYQATTGLWTIINVTGLTSLDQGRYITFTGWANDGGLGPTGAPHNGTFKITSVSGTTITVVNHNAGTAATDANNGSGSVSWSVGGGYVTTFLGIENANAGVIEYRSMRFNNEKNGLFYGQAATGTMPVGWWFWGQDCDTNKLTIAFPDHLAKFPSGQTPAKQWAPWLMNGFHLGSTRLVNPITINSGTAAPTTGYYFRGSRVLNENASGSPGTVNYWQCTVSGSPGTWVAINFPSAGTGASGTAVVDFGAFPGTTDATVAVTGQASILSGSTVRAWIQIADSADHSADEHIVLATMVDVVTSDIVAGTGFTIRILARDMGGSPLAQPGAGRNHKALLATAASHNNRPELFPSVGGKTINTVWGQVNVAWQWS